MALAALLGTASMRILIQGARRMPVQHRPLRLQLLAVVMLLPCLQASAEPPQPAPRRDGAHDFDFLIGDWKAHVKRLPERRGGSAPRIGNGGGSPYKKVPA